MFFHEKTCQARAMHLQAFVSLGSYLHCSREDIKTEKVEVDEDQYDADDDDYDESRLVLQQC